MLGLRWFWFAGLAQKRIAAALLLGVILVVVSTSVGQVWALTVTPVSPTAGQSFTISGTCPPAGGATCSVYVWSGPGCAVFQVIFVQIDIPLGPYSVTVPGQSAGSYSAYTVNDPSGGCTNFTVIPLNTPVGGTMTHANITGQFSTWLAVIGALTFIVVVVAAKKRAK
jgi:hypothetical protein